MQCAQMLLEVLKYIIQFLQFSKSFCMLRFVQYVLIKPLSINEFNLLMIMSKANLILH